MTYTRLSAGNRWSRKERTDATVAGAAVKLKSFPINKMMVHVTGAEGILRRSVNFGENWFDSPMLAATDACLDVVEDPDGNIWGLFLSTGTTTAKVGFSDDGMDTWTLKYTHTAGKQAFNIAVSPERAAQSKIAFTSRNADDTDSECVISTDSGDTWDIKLMGFQLDAGNDAPLIQFMGGQVVVMLRGQVTPLPTTAAWEAVATQSFRFVDAWGAGEADPGIGGDGSFNPDTDRGIVFLHSASGDPIFVVSGANATLLDAFDSGTPANFGGDGHEWWRLYYIEITDPTIDFSGTTGVVRNCTFFRSSETLVATEHTTVRELSYHGSSFGHAQEIATASQSTEFGDALWTLVDHAERSIDDLFFDKTFHHTDEMVFDHDFSRHNSAFVPLLPGGGADSAIDWYLDAEDDESSHSIVFSLEANAFADVFPGSCRVLAVAASVLLRGLYQDLTLIPSTIVINSNDDGDTWEITYQNDDAPLPVELIRYGDTSPLFGAVSAPNKVIRYTGGDEWEEFDDPITEAGESFDGAALAYDLVSDRLFVSYLTSPIIFALKDASIADSAQANAVMAATEDILEEGVEGYWTIIPSTNEPPVAYRQLVVQKKERPA